LAEHFSDKLAGWSENYCRGRGHYPPKFDRSGRE
jgi:hypothetical protein